MSYWRRLPVVVVAAAAVAFAAIAAAADAPRATTQRTLVFGTEVAVTIPDLPPPDADAAIGRVFALFEEMHERFYPWRDGELRRLNTAIAAAALPITVSSEMAAMLRQALRAAAHSDGLFNPAIGRLVALWGFTGEILPTKPPPLAEIEDFLQHRPPIDFVTLNGRVVVAAHPTALLDFGGLAKGAALDAAARLLRQDGVANALINIGGNVLALGVADGRAWRVALHDSRQRPPLAVVALHDGEAVATSGDGEYFFRYEGRRYHHILDPRTGFPARNTSTAIVISDDAEHAGAISDALATALVIADDEQARRFSERFGVTLFWRVGGGGGEQLSDSLRRRIAESAAVITVNEQ